MIGSDFKRPAPAWVALFMAALWLGGTAWLRPLMAPDEGRYVGVAWEMLRSGDWLVPTLNGLPYFHKPPLFYWITAASLSVFGMGEWAARMAPMLGGLAAASGLYAFALRWAGPSGARLSLLVLVTQPLFFLGAQFANLDMLVAGCISVTVLAAAHAVLQAEQGGPSRGALATAYLFAALGVLAKGLIGAVLPGLVVLAWLLALRKWRAALSLFWLPGIALFLAVAAPWFIAMQWRFPQFADYFFVVQHFKRFAQGGFNNAQPFWFYPAVLALLTLPWFAWLPSAARFSYWSDPQQGPVRKLMWIWLAVVTLFFSIPQSKLLGYVLPVTVPLAFLVGDSAQWGVANRLRTRRLCQVSAAVAMAVCLASVVVVAIAPNRYLRDMGRTLADQVAPQDSVVFLQGYLFEIPFYARLRSPVKVVEDWADPEIALRDNWRKELLDAEQFAPPSAPPVLMSPQQFSAAACDGATTWVVGDYRMKPRYPELAAAVEIARTAETVLWRVPARPPGALSPAGCPGKPSANSAGK